MTYSVNILYNKSKSKSIPIKNFVFNFNFNISFILLLCVADYLPSRQYHPRFCVLRHCNINLEFSAD